MEHHNIKKQLHELIINCLFILAIIIQINVTIAAEIPINDAANLSNKNRHWLVWYGNDNRVHRQQVNANDYLELRNSLNQVRTEDRERLIKLADEYLKVDLRTVFVELDARRESFLMSLFDFGASSSLLGTALTAAETALSLKNDERALEQVREITAKELVSRFRSQLIAPRGMLRTLRSAAGRSLNLLKQDLLQNCDRYDRAFRGFVLESNTTMETLDDSNGWQIDISWRPETATFRSLCAGLRQIDPGIFLVESALMESFSNAEPVIYNEALELVLPIVKTALELKAHTADTVNSLGSWGIPEILASPPATIISYISYTKPLARRIGERLDVRHKRPMFRIILQKTLDTLQADLMARLKRTCDEFITTELDRIELGLAARGEGVWSLP